MWRGGRGGGGGGETNLYLVFEIVLEGDNTSYSRI